MKDIYLTPNGIWVCYGKFDIFFGWMYDDDKGEKMDCYHNRNDNKLSRDAG